MHIYIIKCSKKTWHGSFCVLNTTGIFNYIFYFILEILFNGDLFENKQMSYLRKTNLNR